MLADAVSGDYALDPGNFQKIGDALSLLRGGDHAVAPKTSGWVTTIDNVLCVLLYRDPHAFRRHFVGELRLKLLLEGTKTTKLAAYENAQLLRAIKESLRFAFVGLPEDATAAANCFDVDDIVLREKSSERQHLWR